MSETKLTDNISIKTQLIAKIPELYDKYDDDRRRQRDDVRELRNAIYDNEQAAAEKSDEWCFKAKNSDIYELAVTLKAHFAAQTYKEPDMMFNVEGRDEQAEKNANAYKQYLVHNFNEMGLYKQFDKVVDDLVEIGEGIFFVGQEERKKKFRRQGEDFTPEITEKTVYSGAKASRVDPLNFVFDKRNVKDGNSCLEMYRTYIDVYDILDNANYEISECVKEDLINISGAADEAGNNHNKQTDQPDNQSVKDGMIEVIEAWGDVRLDDNTRLQDKLIVVVARKYVVRFEDNPFIGSPFVHCKLIEDPDTMRGVSPIRVALSTSKASQELLNKQMNMLSLQLNPPYLAPKGCFKGNQSVEPGKIIEYDPALMPQAPQAIKFNGSIGWDFLNHFSQKQESATGIFKNMMGALAQNERTATEIKAATTSQNVRLDDYTDDINNYLIIPMVEKVADIDGNFNFESTTFRAKNNGEYENIVITPEIRQANYRFTYGDRKSIQHKRLQLQELRQDLTALAQTPAGQDINWSEVFKQTLSVRGYENPDKYILDENEKLQLALSQIMLQARIEQVKRQVRQQMGANDGNNGQATGSIAQQPNQNTGMERLSGIPQAAGVGQPEQAARQGVLAGAAA
jgi:hypothetical protein